MAEDLDMEAWKARMKQQKMTLKAAKGRKGQKAENKGSRMVLEVEFSLLRQRMSSSSGQEHHHMRQGWIEYSYPPAMTPFSKFQPIDISDLRLETHHTGKVQFVKTFGHPIRIMSVQNAVEDVQGNVDRLALYNTNPKLEPTQLLAKGSIFAIKEPFYKGTADGGVTIRVDHPSDLVRLQPLDPSVPVGLAPQLVETDKTVETYKTDGNAAYGQKEYLMAIEAYTLALAKVADTQIPLKCDLFRNRAMANLFLKRYERALDDALSSIIPGELQGIERHAKLNSKAYYRAGRAAYELGRFIEANANHEEALLFEPGDEDASRELKRSQSRLEERSTGRYEFSMMKSATKKGNKPLDHASYTRRVEVCDAGTHGRGLFAKEAIKAGEIVLCEKAFLVSFNEDRRRGDTFALCNLNTDRVSIGSQATLLFDVVEKMLHNPVEASRFFQLHDGGYFPKCTAQQVDGVTAVDAFHVQAILEHNSFGTNNAANKSKAVPGTTSSRDRQEDMMSATGIWGTASYANHSCMGNTRRVFYGDMMIVRATTPIAAGQEVFMPYRSPDYIHSASRQRLQEQWHFACDCAMCEAEIQSSAAQLRTRAGLLKQAERLCKESDPGTCLVSAALFNKGEKLYRDLRATYDEAFYTLVPRVGLAYLGCWLIGARPCTSPTFTLATAFQTLQDLGYEVVVKGETVDIDREHCHLDLCAIDVAAHASEAYVLPGQRALADQFREFARESYVTLCGDEEGFEGRYGARW